MSAHHFSRRALLGAFAAGPAALQRALASSPLTYSTVLRPARALVGEPIVATLACVASAPSEAATFEDASLMFELRRMPPESDPAVVFPNRGGVDRGNLQVRMAPEGRRRLARGERLVRTVDLVSLYPSWTLGTGDFVFSYQIGPEARPWHAQPAKLTVESGPEAVPALFKRLDQSDTGVRARAAGLLHKMTAHIAGYAPEGEPAEREEAIARWRRWWETAGRKMPWSFLSVGATFEDRPAVRTARRRSPMLGGVAYQRRPLGAVGVSAVTGALAEWQRATPASAAALQGRVWVADRLFAYPGDEVVFDPGDQVATLLDAALSRLAQLASSAAADATGAPIILATVARFPDRRFVGSLSAVQSAARRSPAWRRAGFVADGLLDLLDGG
jgi:hypothetical protein